MGKLIDLTGKVYGRLTVINRSDKNGNKGQPKWDCKCTCGNIKSIVGADLRAGSQTKSCGCIKGPGGKVTHGLSKTALYNNWTGIKDRCNNPKTNDYTRYGGRGISICKEWSDDFVKFYDWAKDNGYKKGMQLDRINNNGDYSPNNCRYVTGMVNMNNTRANKMITYRDVTCTMSQWCYYLNLDYKIIKDRLRAEWLIERALETSITRHKKKVVNE